MDDVLDLTSPEKEHDSDTPQADLASGHHPEQMNQN